MGQSEETYSNTPLTVFGASSEVNQITGYNVEEVIKNYGFDYFLRRWSAMWIDLIVVIGMILFVWFADRIIGKMFYGPLF